MGLLLCWVSTGFPSCISNPTCWSSWWLLAGTFRCFLGYFLRCFLTKFLYLRFVIPLGLGGVGGRWSLLSKLESLDFDSSVHFCPLPSLRGPSPITSEGYSGPNVRTLPTNLDGVWNPWDPNHENFLNNKSAQLNNTTPIDAMTEECED